MNKLTVFLEDKFENKRIENKEERINLVLKIAELNFKSQKDDCEIKLGELFEKFKSDESVEDIIQQIGDTFDEIEEAELGLKKVQKIKNYLFEEVKIK